MKKCLHVRSVTVLSRNLIQNAHIAVQFSKRKRKKNPNRLEKDHLDPHDLDRLVQRNPAEGLLDLLAPDHPDQRNREEGPLDLRNQEDLLDLLAPDHPGRRNREEARLGLRNQGDPLDLLVPDQVGHRKADHPDQRKADRLEHRREDHPDQRKADHLVEDRQREGLLDQRKADLLGQKKADHLDQNVALQSDEAFICLKSPMILETFVFLENCGHLKLLQYQ